jgi:hypothetical protein
MEKLKYATEKIKVPQLRNFFFVKIRILKISDQTRKKSFMQGKPLGQRSFNYIKRYFIDCSAWKNWGNKNING